MCSLCEQRAKARAKTISTLAAAVTPETFNVRCVNCTGVYQASNGTIYPLGSGEWYVLKGNDIYAWMVTGVSFEFETEELANHFRELYFIDN